MSKMILIAIFSSLITIGVTTAIFNPFGEKVEKVESMNEITDSEIPSDFIAENPETTENYSEQKKIEIPLDMTQKNESPDTFKTILLKDDIPSKF